MECVVLVATLHGLERSHQEERGAEPGLDSKEEEPWVVGQQEPGEEVLERDTGWASVYALDSRCSSLGMGARAGRKVDRAPEGSLSPAPQRKECKNIPAVLPTLWL